MAALFSETDLAPFLLSDTAFTLLPPSPLGVWPFLGFLLRFDFLPSLVPASPSAGVVCTVTPRPFPATNTTPDASCGARFAAALETAAKAASFDVSALVVAAADFAFAAFDFALAALVSRR